MPIKKYSLSVVMETTVMMVKKCSFFLKGFGIESKIFLIDKQAKQIPKKIMDILQDSEIVVDCIFGIGVNRIVDNFYKEIINSLNFSKRRLYRLTFRAVFVPIQERFLEQLLRLT